MPAVVDPSDRRILLFAAVVLFLLCAAMIFVTPPENQGFNVTPSSYSVSSGGARAAFLLLEDLQFHPVRWEHSPTDLPGPDGALLILANPTIPPSADERAALLNFVNRGGYVLFTGPRIKDFFPQAPPISPDPVQSTWQVFSALLPSTFTRGAWQIELQPRARWGQCDSTQTALYGDPQSPVVVSWRLGLGRILWWAAPTPLTNAGISEQHNLELFLDVVRSAPDHSAPPRIYWDEYFHGERGSLWSYAWETPIPWAILQLALLGLAIFFTFGRRSGPIVIPPAVSRLSPLEFVDTLGGLYQRAGAAPAAVGVVYHRFRTLLARRWGLPINVSDAALADSAERSFGWKQSGLAAAMRRAADASRAPKIAAVDALDIIRDLESREDQLGFRLRKSQENK